MSHALDLHRAHERSALEVRVAHLDETIATAQLSVQRDLRRLALSERRVLTLARSRARLRQRIEAMS